MLATRLKAVLSEAPPPIIHDEYTGPYVISTTATYTFNNISVGGNGLLVICTGSKSRNTGILNGVTVNGSSGTVELARAGYANDAGTTGGMGVFNWTGGATSSLSVSISYSSTKLAAALHVFRVENADTVASKTSSIYGDYTSGGTITVPSVPENAALIGFYSHSDYGLNESTLAWTGLTERGFFDPSNSTTYGNAWGYDVVPSAGNKTFTVSHNTSRGAKVFLGASFIAG